MKTARQYNAPFIPEVHFVGGDTAAVDELSLLFEAVGWVVIREKP